MLHPPSTASYQQLLHKRAVRVVVLGLPWVFVPSLVCGLWLGCHMKVPEIEDLDLHGHGVCYHAVTNAARTASDCITVFIPAFAIFVLFIFVFIAVFGEMPTQSYTMSRHSVASERHEPGQRSNTYYLDQHDTMSRSHSKKERQFVAALLVVDFITLAVSLPFPAFSLVSPGCDEDVENCDQETIQNLFVTLMWLRSSIACIRPVLFILLTDVYSQAKTSIKQCLCQGLGGGDTVVSGDSGDWRHSRVALDPSGTESRELTTFVPHAPDVVPLDQQRDETTVTSTISPPASPRHAKVTSTAWKDGNAAVTTHTMMVTYPVNCRGDYDDGVPL